MNVQSKVRVSGLTVVKSEPRKDIKYISVIYIKSLLTVILGMIQEICEIDKTKIRIRKINQNKINR